MTPSPDKAAVAPIETVAQAIWSEGYNPTGHKKWPDDVRGGSQDLFRRMARAAISAIDPAFLARIEALEQALEPFATSVYAKLTPDEADDDVTICDGIRIADLRRARTLILGGPDAG